jgi:hypothetical protein
VTIAGAHGITDIHADAYHADPCETPSLSASIAHILCTASPAHARAAHPKLNPDLQREHKDAFDLGNVVHELVLDQDTTLKVLDYPDWRTKAAQEDRDECRENGWIPLLSKDYERVEQMFDAVRRQLADLNVVPSLFTDGQPERTLMWEEPGGVMCRARLDWLRDDLAAVDDLKTTSRSANPEAYSRALFGVGGDVQAAFYIRGVQELTGETPEFRWVVVETSAPFALSVVAPAPDVLELGHRKVGHAIRLWRDCLASGMWPGYPDRVCWANAPDYEVARWMDREALIEEAA